VMLPVIENGAHMNWAAVEDLVLVALAMIMVATSLGQAAHAAACTEGTASPDCLLVLLQGMRRLREKQAGPMVLADVAKQIVAEDADLAGCLWNLCPSETSIR